MKLAKQRGGGAMQREKRYNEMQNGTGEVRGGLDHVLMIKKKGGKGGIEGKWR